eukprot:scaffold36031_cov152-Isochrysis_galbana.AAC.1
MVDIEVDKAAARIDPAQAEQPTLGGREDRRKRGVLLCIGLEAWPVVLEWVGVCIGTVPNQNTYSGVWRAAPFASSPHPSAIGRSTATGPAGKGGGEDKRKKGRPHIGICTVLDHTSTQKMVSA